MKKAMILTAAAFALAFSAHSASAQVSGGGGGTIGCDPSLPVTGSARASDCRLYHKEALYGPSANPYAAAWDRPAVKHKKVVHTKKVSKTRKTKTSGNAD